MLCLALASPHILYALIWLRPNAWRKPFGDKSTDALAVVATGLKVLQGAACWLWLSGQRNGDLCLDFSSVQAWRWYTCAVLVGAGQTLNIGTYLTLGRTGVYYGSKLGHSIPWVNGFPFSLVSHPQYFGSALTLWGAGALASAFQPLCWNVTLYWTALYAATALIEDFTEPPSAPQKKADDLPAGAPPRESANVVRMRI